MSIARGDPAATPGPWHGGRALSGVILAALVSIAAVHGAAWIGESLMGFDRSPISAIMLAILIGILIANTLKVPGAMLPGLRFCASTVLRIGIMLLGIRLSLLAAGRFTLVALPFVIAAIGIGLVTVALLGRWLGLTRRLSGLIAVGTGICGCTAIVATAPLIEADESEVSYAIACITIFGLAAMFLYPYLAHAIFADQPQLAGLFIGTSIHETAQVAGAGLMYASQYSAPAALDVATVTKLVRNLCMIAVIPMVGALYGRARVRGPDTEPAHWLSLVPWFIIGFALMSALRTLGDIGARPFGLLEPATWQKAVNVMRDAAEYCLLLAMAAVGLTTRFAGIARIGVRPFALGLFAALLIGGVSLAAIAVFATPLIILLGL